MNWSVGVLVKVWPDRRIETSMINIVGLIVAVLKLAGQSELKLKMSE